MHKKAPNERGKIKTPCGYVFARQRYRLHSSPRYLSAYHRIERAGDALRIAHSRYSVNTCDVHYSPRAFSIASANR